MLLDKFLLKIVPSNRIFLFFVLLVFNQYASAQKDISVRQGSYEVFFSAFNSSFLSPEVARAVDIVRAKNRALLNISIVEHLENGETQAVAAKNIEGNVYDLIYRNTLKFQEIIEPGARYYLAPFKINNDNEMMQVTVLVVPENSNETIEVKFKRHFYLN